MYHEPLTGYQPGSSQSSIALPEDMQHSMLAVPLLGERSYAFWAENPVKQGFPVRIPGSATPTVLAARTFTNSG
jgi:hypothetical protein